MLEMVRSVNALRINGEISSLEEKIVCDEEIELIINDTVSRRFSISPNFLKEFATGYVLGEGLAVSVDDIINVNVHNRNINVEIDLADFDIRKELIVGSDCFGGWRRKIELVDPVESDFQIPKKTIYEAFKILKNEAQVWEETGGTHVAGLVNKDEFIAIEDVSRHVAVDKVIGAGALNKFDFSQSFIVYSGRMPADMLIKIARVGIPILASNAAPTSSGFTVAKESRVTMIGFVRGDRLNIYTHPYRILV